MGAVPALVGVKSMSDSLEGRRGVTCEGVRGTACDPAILLLSGHHRETLHGCDWKKAAVRTGGLIVVGPQRRHLDHQ